MTIIYAPSPERMQALFDKVKNEAGNITQVEIDALAKSKDLSDLDKKLIVASFREQKEKAQKDTDMLTGPYDANQGSMTWEEFWSATSMLYNRIVNPPSSQTQVFARNFASKVENR